MKTTTHLSIDSDLKEMAKIRRFQDKDFSLSETVNDFLRDFFEDDVANLESKKLNVEEAELQRKLALIQSQKKALETQEIKQDKEKWAKMGFKKKPEEVDLKDET